MDDRQQSIEYVLQAAREHDVKFIRLWFTDILGFLKSVAITVEGLPGALEEGIGFDGSSIEGFARIDESDMTAMPDPSTFAILPWRPSERRVARMFCDILHPDLTPFDGDPRYILRRNLKRAADRVNREMRYDVEPRPHEGEVEALDVPAFFGKALPFAEAEGFLTDEDVFGTVS